MERIASAQRDSATAILHLKKAVALAPESSAPHYRLWLLYRKTGQTAEAQKERELFEKLKAAGTQVRISTELFNTCGTDNQIMLKRRQEQVRIVLHPLQSNLESTRRKPANTDEQKIFPPVSINRIFPLIGWPSGLSVTSRESARYTA